LSIEGQKKLLALDGGGIRGVLTLEVLARIEQILREQSRRPNLVLANYFDYVAGTSTGAIIATCVSLGMTVDAIRRFYLESGPAMFSKSGLLERFRYKFQDEALSNKLRQVFGANETLGSAKLKTLLMMVLRNATTDSPWPLSNNPQAKYNDRPDGKQSNLKLPLWQLVRASTAAPTYFPPEVVSIDGREHLFVDGGVTMYNNPAFQLFLMATIKPFRLEWQPGEDKMLLISVGTGTSPEANQDLKPGEMNLFFNAHKIPSALMSAALNEQDLLCRVFGKTLAGDAIDRELGDLIGVSSPVGAKAFTYARYNAELTTAGLNDLGIIDIEPDDVRALDSVEHIEKLARVGRAVASQRVRPEHFANFPV
jgi:uncharacterized protein